MTTSIEFIRTRDGKLSVDRHWPYVTRIAVALLNSPDCDSVMTREPASNEIEIEVENGSATYRIRSLLSDGSYFCDLVRCDWVQA